MRQVFLVGVTLVVAVLVGRYLARHTGVPDAAAWRWRIPTAPDRAGTGGGLAS